jgi:hypothetical protein
VIQRSDQVRFALEPREALPVAGEGARQHLQSDVAVQLRVAAPIHLPMPPLPMRGPTS